MRIDEAAGDEVFATTRVWMGEYNAAFLEWRRTPVRLAAYDADGELAGSLRGKMYWGKMRVDNLVVRVDCRRRGIGSALMRSAEQIARDAGCSGVYLDTMSFQALEFYRKIGYETLGSLDGFENDTARHWLHKPIT